MDKKWDAVWDVFPDLSNTISWTSLHISYTSTSSPTPNSTSSVTSTTTSHIYPHNTGYQYADTTTSSNSTSKSSQTICGTTSTAISKATSIPTFPIIFSPDDRYTKTKANSKHLLALAYQRDANQHWIYYLQRHQNQTAQEIHSPIQGALKQPLIKYKHQFLNLHSKHHCHKIHI